MTDQPEPTSPAGPQAQPLLQAKALTKHFRLGGMLAKQTLHAVDSVDLEIHEREIVALVGESGSGKSTIARLLARIYTPTSGEIYYRGRPLSRLRSRRDMNWYRGEVPMVFQDPFSAFNPVHRISHGLMRNLALHRHELHGAERRREAERVSESVGLSTRLLSPTETVLSDPKHPYTRLLLSAVADPSEAEPEFAHDTGEPPRVINPSEGCRFRWRCPFAVDACHTITPLPRTIGTSEVACHVAGEAATQVANEARSF